MFGTIKNSAKLAWLSLIASATLLVGAGHLATPDAHLRIAQAIEIVDNGTFVVPDDVGNPSHGNLAVGRGGHRYSVYNPGHILVLTVPYLIAKALPDLAGVHDHYVAEFFASFLGPAAHFLCAYVLVSVRLKLGFSRDAALVAALLYATATVALPHATDGYEHPYEALSILVALRFAIMARQSSGVHSGRWFALLAGVAIGCGILFRNTALLALPGLLIVVANCRARVLLGVGTLPFLLFLVTYNALRFGSLFETGYTQAWSFTTGSEIGFFSTPLVVGLFGLWLSCGKGLLLFSPAVILGLSGLPYLMSRHRPVAVAIVTTGILYSCFYGMNFAWHGSPWCWGPRYLIPIVPLVMLALPGHMPRSKMIRITAGAIVIASISIQVAAITADYRRHLIQVLILDPRAFDDGRLFFSLRESPLVGQFTAAKHVIRQTMEGRVLRPYISPGRWKNEARPASQSMMLADSLNLNSVDLWWLRLTHLEQCRRFYWLFLVAGCGFAASTGLGLVWVYRTTDP